MKILYAIQATGNGHISRAKALIPHLKKYGEVDFLMSGKTASIPFPCDVKYQFPGLSLFYDARGSLSYFKTFRGNSLTALIKNINDLPVEQYDIIINDFEFITAAACRLKHKASVHFGHQASFQSARVPRPENSNPLQEFILKNFAIASHYIGLHFQCYDAFIYPPILRPEVIHVDPEDLGHITVYLPSVSTTFLTTQLSKIKSQRFHLFSAEIVKSRLEGNITYFPTDHEWFTRSMIESHGVITGGGFETPSEALSLGKKLLCIPIKAHYEQQCNAAALQLMGIEVLHEVGPDFSQRVQHWMESGKCQQQLFENNVEKTIEAVMSSIKK